MDIGTTDHLKENEPMVRDRCIVVDARDKGILHMGPAATGCFPSAGTSKA
jgi:hypothetical protein